MSNHKTTFRKTINIENRFYEAVSLENFLKHNDYIFTQNNFEVY